MSHVDTITDADVPILSDPAWREIARTLDVIPGETVVRALMAVDWPTLARTPNELTVDDVARSLELIVRAYEFAREGEV